MSLFAAFAVASMNAEFNNLQHLVLHYLHWLKMFIQYIIWGSASSVMIKCNFRCVYSSSKPLRPQCCL